MSQKVPKLSCQLCRVGLNWNQIIYEVDKMIIRYTVVIAILFMAAVSGGFAGVIVDIVEPGSAVRKIGLNRSLLEPKACPVHTYTEALHKESGRQIHHAPRLRHLTPNPILCAALSHAGAAARSCCPFRASRDGLRSGEGRVRCRVRLGY